MSRKNYFEFSTFGLKSYIDKTLINIRASIYNDFIGTFNITEDDDILDVGVSAEDHPSSNYLEKNYPYTHKITALSEENHSELVEIYRGLRFVTGDGRNLPFSDNSFDYVYSHAVIEHVGCYNSQRKFISELCRVAKKGIFITTPNRWHFLEFHTGYPLIHLLPTSIYRRIYMVTGKRRYSDEEDLNLMSRGDIKKILHDLKITNYNFSFVYFLAQKSNIILSISKRNDPKIS